MWRSEKEPIKQILVGHCFRAVDIKSSQAHKRNRTTWIGERYLHPLLRPISYSNMRLYLRAHARNLTSTFSTWRHDTNMQSTAAPVNERTKSSLHNAKTSQFLLLILSHYLSTLQQFQLFIRCGRLTALKATILKNTHKKSAIFDKNYFCAWLFVKLLKLKQVKQKRFQGGDLKNVLASDLVWTLRSRWISPSVFTIPTEQKRPHARTHVDFNARLRKRSNTTKRTKIFKCSVVSCSSSPASFGANGMSNDSQKASNGVSGTESTYIYDKCNQKREENDLKMCRIDGTRSLLGGRNSTDF